MKLWQAAVTAMLAAGLATAASAQQTMLQILGGQQRPDVMRKIADEYQKKNPNVKIEVEVGGATSEGSSNTSRPCLRRRTRRRPFPRRRHPPRARRPPGWTEPLDNYLGADKEKVMSGYLAAYPEANLFNGKVIALPFFADSQFIYYRKDLLEKYRRPVPQTWDDLYTAKNIVNGEKNPHLQGFSTAGAPIEGTVCTYLVPMWAAGGEPHEGGSSRSTRSGTPNLPALRPKNKSGVLPTNIAEIPTDRIRMDMQAGNLLFAMTWVYVYNLLQTDEDTK